MAEEPRFAPDAFLLIRYGDNTYTKDGRSGAFLFDESSADALISEFTGRGRDLVIDFEHSTLSGKEAPAAGWIDRLEKTPDGLAAHVKYWTEKAKGYLENGEYRYFSPTLMFIRGTQKPNALHSVALTNHPALHGIDALVANDWNPSGQPDINKERKFVMTKTETALQKLLGDTVLSLNDSTDGAVASRIEALAEELPELRRKAAQCDTLILAEEQAQKLALFDKGIARKAFCNAQKDVLLKMPLEDLKKLEEATPDNAALPDKLPETPIKTEKEKEVELLSDEEKEMARKMNLSDEEFAEIKKKTENMEKENA